MYTCVYFSNAGKHSVLLSKSDERIRRRSSITAPKPYGTLSPAFVRKLGNSRWSSADHGYGFTAVLGPRWLFTANVFDNVCNSLHRFRLNPPDALSTSRRAMVESKPLRSLKVQTCKISIVIAVTTSLIIIQRDSQAGVSKYIRSMFEHHYIAFGIL